jgi:cytochrome b561
MDFGVPSETTALLDAEGDAKAPRRRYDRLSRILHWSVAVGIIYTLIVGYAMHLVEDEALHHVLSTLNMSVATVLMALMSVRFVWRFFRPPVSHGHHLRSMQQTVAEFAHEVFYLIIFCVLISGFLMLKHSFAFFGFVEFPRLVHENAVNDFFFDVHRVGCIALVAMLVLHVVAVIKHQTIDKYPILARMS